jgi:hypothetical protein
MNWSNSEKKIAHRVFNAALEHEVAEMIARFKEMAAEAAGPDDLWEIEDWLTERRREMDSKYDYRYSQLIMVFGRLMREGRITAEQLAGLGADKMAIINRIATL